MTKPSSTNNMSFYGIDVRYYTAIQAMRELIGIGFYDPKLVSKRAFAIADEMMKERTDNGS